MTLEQTTAALLAALDAGDLPGLDHALAARAALLADYASSVPSAALALRLNTAFEAGEKICTGLKELKLRLAQESGHIGQIQDAFVRNPFLTPIRLIDCRG